MRFSIVIPGAPRTKKNSSRIITITRKQYNPKTRKVEPRRFNKILPSEAHEEWFEAAMKYALPLRQCLQKRGVTLPISGPIAVNAQFYRSTDGPGDLIGYEQAISDWLQVPIVSKSGKQTRNGAGIIVDDRQICSWDGSRLKIDRDRPRIEVTITAESSLFDEISTVVEGEGRHE